MNTDGTGFHTCKECHKTESLWNRTATDQMEGEQLEDWRCVGASSCNFGDGTDQSVRSLMFIVMMMVVVVVVLQPKQASLVPLTTGGHKCKNPLFLSSMEIYSTSAHEHVFALLELASRSLSTSTKTRTAAGYLRSTFLPLRNRTQVSV